MITVRPLTPLDAIDYWAVRLHGLFHQPIAFAGCYDAECLLTVADFAASIPEQPDISVILGAFSSAELVGIVGLEVPRIEKLKHRATLWGMYTMPSVRGMGVGRLLMDELLAYARTQTAIEQIHLAVTACNIAARNWYEKCGFALYAVQRRAVKIADVYEDDEWRVLEMERGDDAPGGVSADHPLPASDHQ